MAQRGREGAMSGRRIMTADEIRRATIRLSHEIVEKQAGTDGLLLIGIQRRGVPLAQRIAAAILENEGAQVPVGALDITFYRDDLTRLAHAPIVKRSDLEVDVGGRVVVLVDDVLYTGRTVRAAMNELFDYGRPESIDLVVLIDRGERQLPICAQHCGATLAVPKGSMLRLDRDDSGRLTLQLDDA